MNVGENQPSADCTVTRLQEQFSGKDCYCLTRGLRCRPMPSLIANAFLENIVITDSIRYRYGRECNVILHNHPPPTQPPPQATPWGESLVEPFTALSSSSNLVQIPALPSITCVILSNLPSLPMPPFPHL